MKSILLVSHSKKITDGLKEMIEEMIGTDSEVSIYSLGGTEDGRLGTDAVKIMTAIAESNQCEDIFVFCDIGSALLSTETALELIDEEMIEKVVIMDAPLVEGAFAAGVQASVGCDRTTILKEIETIKA